MKGQAVPQQAAVSLGAPVDESVSRLASERSRFTSLLTIVTVFDCLSIGVFFLNVMFLIFTSPNGRLHYTYSFLHVMFLVSSIVAGYKGRYRKGYLLYFLVTRIIQLVLSGIGILIAGLVVVALLIFLVFGIALFANVDFESVATPISTLPDSADVAAAGGAAVAIILIFLVIIFFSCCVGFVYLGVLVAAVSSGFKLMRLMDQHAMNNTVINGVELQATPDMGFDSTNPSVYPPTAMPQQYAQQPMPQMPQQPMPQISQQSMPQQPSYNPAVVYAFPPNTNQG